MTDINTELEQIADEEFVDDTQLDEVAADAPKKGAAPAEKMDSVEGERQDMGPAVVSPDAKTDPGKEASKKVGKASPPKTKPSDASAKMEEVEEEDTDHQVFYTVGSPLVMNVVSTNNDSDGNPLGTKFKIDGISSAGSGTVSYTHLTLPPSDLV